MFLASVQKTNWTRFPWFVQVPLQDLLFDLTALSLPLEMHLYFEDFFFWNMMPP